MRHRTAKLRADRRKALKAVDRRRWRKWNTWHQAQRRRLEAPRHDSYHGSAGSPLTPLPVFPW